MPLSTSRTRIWLQDDEAYEDTLVLLGLLSLDVDSLGSLMDRDLLCFIAQVPLASI